MLDAAIGPEFSFRYTNFSAPTGPPFGTSIVPGISNAEGNWTQVASAANIATDVFGLELAVNGGSGAGVARNMLLDVGIDPTGGSSYASIISDLVCGCSGLTTAGRHFYFPIRIPAGASVAVRVQNSHSIAGTVRVIAKFYGLPQRPELVRVGSFSETIGTITNSNGVAFTPGVSGAWGSWTLLGTTGKALWWWQVGMQIDDATMSAQTVMVDLAYGDASNKVPIIEYFMHSMTVSETINHVCALNAYKRVPAGSNIYIRGSIDISPADSNYNAVAVGIGG